MGFIVVPDDHGLYDPGVGPQPTLNKSAFDIGFRASYMPLRFLGVGIETGVMPTRSSSEDARANLWTFRAQVIGQLPMYRITPTLVIGGGGLGVRSDADILNSTDGVFHWGPGVKMYLTEWVALRLDGRHLIAGSDAGRVHYGEVLLGVDVTLRLLRWIGDDASRNSDADGDLVPDRVDQCPNEYGEDDVGCPTDRDSDKDGVPDKRDRCPKEWGDQPNGCPIKDSDNDGILDTVDSCEDEPENFNGFEDKDGCPDEPPEEIKKISGVIEGIRFPSGKATIRTSSRRVLNEVVDTMKKYPEIRILISGHTDDTGKHDDNVDLSEARASSVRDYLVDKGVAEERIETKGLGPDEPVADNKTKAGRALNRRIEFKIVP
jgi:outer membrane protein OmpA-like peptidoglycan-associated protein